jgi:hypothetical protein
MFPLRDITRGFLLAPIIPVALVFGLGGILDAVSIAKWSASDVFLHSLFVFVYFTIACYVLLVIFALPLYLLVWGFSRVSLFSCLLGGFIIGGGLLLVPFALQYVGHLPNFTSESLGGQILVINGHFTHAGIVNRLEGVAESALFGAAIAFAFWWIAIRNDPRAQSRKNATT